MKKTISLVIFSLLLLTTYPQQVQIVWQQCYGGSDMDTGKDVIVLNNGHILVLSTTYSNSGDIGFNQGKSDFWLFETDAFGNFLWGKTYGGSENEYAKSLVQTPDGGYVMFGDTDSNNGDVSGNHGSFDYWVIKTDNIGNVLWHRCLGSTKRDLATGFNIDEAGNIYCIGLSSGEDGDVTQNNGYDDYWFVKLDLDGELIWNRNLGGSYADNGLCISSTNDGGVIVGGIISSIDGDITCNMVLGNKTAWVIKLDSLNSIQWQQCYGGTYTETVVEIESTSDGGYILLGATNSNDGDVSGFHGYPGDVNIYDIWVIKVDSMGVIEWQRCLGGTKDESPSFIKITPDGNYLVGGFTYSSDGDVSGNHSNSVGSDHWVVKLDPSGEIIWQQCFGGITEDELYGGYVISESEYVFVGNRRTSSTGGNIDCNAIGGFGDWDLVMYKILDTTVGISTIEEDKLPLKVYPNPAANSATFSYNLPDGIQQGSIEVHNTTGLLVASTSLNEAKGEWVLQLNNIPPGLYIYTLSTQQKTTTGKLVVTR